MKRTALILGLLALAIGFSSCRDPKKNPDGKGTEIKILNISPDNMRLKVGETGKITASWAPNIAVKPEFTSEKPEVASVDAEGTVTAVAKGFTNIKVKVGAKEKSCAVVVLDGTEVKPENELPLIEFENVEAIKKYEESLDRKFVEKGLKLYTNIISGFINPFLDVVPAVAYGIQISSTKIINLAYCTESIDNCPKVLKMLEKSGFVFEKKESKTDGTFYKGVYTKDPYITMELSEYKDTDLKTNTILWIIKKLKQDLKAEVKDFPHAEWVLKHNVEETKQYETSLGFRKFNEKSPVDKGILFYDTIEKKEAETNGFMLIYGTLTNEKTKEPYRLAIYKLNGLKTEAERTADNVKTWFETNGFGTDFAIINGGKGIGKTVWGFNKEKTLRAHIEFWDGADAVLAILDAPKGDPKPSIAEIHKMLNNSEVRNSLRVIKGF